MFELYLGGDFLCWMLLGGEARGFEFNHFHSLTLKQIVSYGSAATRRYSASVQHFQGICKINLSEKEDLLTQGQFPPRIPPSPSNPVNVILKCGERGVWKLTLSRFFLLVVLDTSRQWLVRGFYLKRKEISTSLKAIHLISPFQ